MLNFEHIINIDIVLLCHIETDPVIPSDSDSSRFKKLKLRFQKFLRLTLLVMFYITQLDIHKTVSPAVSGWQHVTTTFISLLPPSDMIIIVQYKYFKILNAYLYFFQATASTITTLHRLVNFQLLVVFEN